METIVVNWDVDWSNCSTIQPKKMRMKWCPNCQELHDKDCFFHYHGGWLGCMINKASRSKAMAKIKGGVKGIK